MNQQSANRKLLRTVRRDLLGYKIWITMICSVVFLQCLQIYWMDIHVHDDKGLRTTLRPVQTQQLQQLLPDKHGDKNVDPIFIQNTVEQDMEASGKCRMMTSPWSKRLREPKMGSNMTDWTFTTKRDCETLSINDLPTSRTQFSLSCSGSQPSIDVSETDSSFDIYTVEFEDQCLYSFIENCCLDENTVPNVVHLVWFGDKQLGFFNFLALMSVHRFVKPCVILIHGPNLPHGPYWDYFLHVAPNVIHVRRDRPETIFGNKLHFVEHSSDVMRIEALLRFGGVYLDFDEVVLRQIDSLRRFHHTQGHELAKTMGSQLVISKRNATFLHLWYLSYKKDYKKIWAYNALWVPNKLAKDHPELIHIEGYNFTRPNWKNTTLIFDHNFNWSRNYAMHMYARWYRRPVDVDKIRTLNTTVGSVARHVLFGNKELCST